MTRDTLGMTKTERGRLINLAREADTASMLEAVGRQALLLRLTDGWPDNWSLEGDEGKKAADIQLEEGEAKTAIKLLEDLFDGKLSSTKRAMSPMGGTIQKTEPIIADGTAAEVFIPVRDRLKRFLEPPKPEPAPAKADALDAKLLEEKAA